MNTTVAKFGYNTELGNDWNIAWNYMGTKYNFNIDGNVLGVFSSNDQYFLLSQVTSSHGDNCMVGTIDAREIIIDSDSNYSYNLVSNNEPSAECMQISKNLSTEKTKQELSEGKSIEQTASFQYLISTGIDLKKQDIQFNETVNVCGIEKEKFENLKNIKMGKTR